MESVYERFNSYNFEGDAAFQKGLRNRPIQEATQGNTLKLKLFYYNRFIEPVDTEGYRQWSRCRVPVSPDCPESGLEGIDHVTKPTEHSELTQVHLDSSSCKRNESLSFTEVFRLVQAGEEVPGVEKMDIIPCKQPPTISQMHRKLKPWESNK